MFLDSLKGYFGEPSHFCHREPSFYREGIVAVIACIQLAIGVNFHLFVVQVEKLIEQHSIKDRWMPSTLDVLFLR